MEKFNSNRSFSLRKQINKHVVYVLKSIISALFVTIQKSWGRISFWRTSNWNKCSYKKHIINFIPPRSIDNKFLRKERGEHVFFFFTKTSKSLSTRGRWGYLSFFCKFEQCLKKCRDAVHSWFIFLYVNLKIYIYIYWVQFPLFLMESYYVNLYLYRNWQDWNFHAPFIDWLNPMFQIPIGHDLAVSLS